MTSKSEPFANGVGMKIWTCYDNLKAQEWFYTSDNRIALQGQGLFVLPPLFHSSPELKLGVGLCLDLPNDILDNGHQVQTWGCGDGNLNQVWTTGMGL